MNTFTIARYNMRQRRLSTVLTCFLVAVGVALVSAIFIIQSEVEKAFNRGVTGKFNLVVGPKGSPLQLVMNAVFYVDTPVGNLPYAYYEQLLDDDRRVKMAIPLVLGDNYQGFKIVGTEPKFLTEFELAEGRRFRFAAGGSFKSDYEIVIGSEVARKTGLGMGQSFLAAHGMVDTKVEGAEHRDQPFRVVGVLEETRTAHDRALFTTLDSLFHLKGHRQEKMLSAVLVLLTGVGPADFVKEVNDGSQAQAVYPQTVIRNLMQIMGKADKILIAIAYVVLLAAGISIFVSLYNSMNERRREIAITRALGAPAGTIFLMIVIEAVTICVIGAVGGLVLSHGTLAAGQSVLRDMTGLSVGAGLPGMQDVLLLFGTLVLGIISSVIPAVHAYRTEVATYIRPIA